MSLFRAEVLAARSARLHGDVMISSSLSTALMSGFIATVAAGGLLFAANASYARTEMVAGIVTSVSPLAKVVAPRPGLVTELLVAEGDVVAAGQPLARVRVEQTSASGVATASAGLAALAEQRSLAETRLALEPVRLAAERRRLQAQMAGEQGYRVTAPIAGRVTALQTAAGRFADGRVPLMTIVPEAAVMQASLQALRSLL